MSNQYVKVGLFSSLLVWGILGTSPFLKPSQALGAQEVGTAQLCLAGLMSEFSWDLGKNDKKRSNGTYSHSNGDIHVFKSRRGSVMCKVDRNRILWANSSGQWRDRSLDTYISYQIEGPQVIIHRRFSDGSTDQLSYQKSKLLHHLPASKTCVPPRK